ncbi:MAG: hypothetical protein JWO96_266 [Candidatus Saccharibacteria bacterium]|nr:hypothetical protein [Candidatus Saccharibacteria bacterium]
MKVLVGTSGWIYKDWDKRFYPADMPDREKLKYYAQHFPTVEVNNSFYRLPSEDNFKNWRAQVHRDFLFSVKLSRFLTHIKRLKLEESTNEGVDRFCSRAQHLRANLGVVLVQLPANFKASEEKVENLAHQFAKAEQNYKMPFPLAMEFRHASWFTYKIFELLRAHNIASVINSSPDMWPASREFTADFAYIRFHGSQTLYASSYTDKELNEWAAFIKKEAGDCSRVYCYFNNDRSARAIENARYLSALLAGQ